MNKSELIQSLNSKYYRILPSERPLKTLGGNLGYYRILVFDKDGDIIKHQKLHFYVENEGGENESAYWDDSEPKLSLPSTFNDEVNDYIQVKIDAGVIEGAFVDNIDSIKKIVYARAIIDVSGNLEEKKIFVDKDANGDLRHRVIG